MRISFLGTGSMIPTIERNHVAVLLSYKNENILVDCGEGTQRQFRYLKISPTKITKILITHWHGDHILGLPGLIQTLSSSKYNKILQIYGPKNSRKYLNNLLKGFSHQADIKIKVTEINQGIFFQNRDFSLESIKLIHPIDCLGYSFIEKDKRNINLEYLKKFGLKQHPILKNLQQGNDIIWKNQKIKASLATEIRKGKKITMISDTNYCNNAIKLAKNSDLLICESTHLDELKEKSEKYKHLTAKQAALVAKNSNSKKLILTHFSQRYKNEEELKKEASVIFKNTTAAKDLTQITL